MQCKPGNFDDVSPSDCVIQYAKTHEEIKGAFHTFQKEADQIYPGWKEKLDCTGKSSVQAATFDWKKEAAAAVTHPRNSSIWRSLPHSYLWGACKLLRRLSFHS